jgi:multidrug resistance efflux pump
MNAPVPATRPAQAQAQPPAVADPAAQAQVAVNTGLNLTKRANEIESLEHMLFFLTNDTRSLMEFDRSFLILHLGGESYFAATNNQPSINKKSLFVAEWNKIAPILKQQEKVVFVSNKIVQGDVPGLELAEEVKNGIKNYIAFAGCTFFLSVPLIHHKQVIGHLVFEFIDAPKPDKNLIGVLLAAAPAFASALAEKWLMEVKPEVGRLFLPAGAETEEGVTKKVVIRLAIVIVAAFALYALLFLYPMTFTVGGEAEITAQKTFMAFARVDGLIKEIFVREGDRVDKDQRVALMDTKDMDFEIAKTEREIKILDEEMKIQIATSLQDKAEEYAKKKLTEEKKKGAMEQLQYLKWKLNFLEIASPIDGIVLTKDVDSLEGKSLKTGEPLIEIAEADKICCEIRVPEERISYVLAGQDAQLFLNTDPTRGHQLKVDKVPPSAKVLPRLGNVFCVRAVFTHRPDHVNIGMKGVGKIEAKKGASLWEILTHRLQTRWNQFTLNF